MTIPSRRVRIPASLQTRFNPGTDADALRDGGKPVFNRPDPSRAETWGLASRAATAPIRAALRRAAMGHEVDDALQEFLLYLIRQDCRRLRRFRGGSEGQFVAYVRVLAHRFVCRYIQRLRIQKIREGSACDRTPRGPSSGPTEAEVLAARRQVVVVMSREEREWLSAVSGLDECLRPLDEPHVPEVTIRRWRRQLVERYSSTIIAWLHFGGVSRSF